MSGMKPHKISWSMHLALFFLMTSLCLMAGCGSGSGGSGSSGNPAPTLVAINPANATVGSVALSLTATGTGFISSSLIEWNGAALTTTMVSSTSLQAQVPASSLASAGTANVTVVNPAPGGGTSQAVVFSINAIQTTNLAVLDVEGNDLVWDSLRQKMYVSVPSAANANANTITIVDPIAGTIVGSQTTDPDPGVLSLSDDGQYLYAGIGGDNAVQRFVLPALTPDIKWTLGTDPTSGAPYTPTDIKVMPGAAHTVAVVRSSPVSRGVVVYDDGVMRPNVACSFDYCYSLQWTSDGTGLYAEDTGSSSLYFYALAVDASGVTMTQQYGGAFRAGGKHLHFDPQTGCAYTDTGEVVNASNAVPVGNYPSHSFVPYGVILSAVDSNLGRVFFLVPVFGPSGQDLFQIQVFDQTNFRLLSTFLISGPASTPVNFIRWGQSGLAFVTNTTGIQSPSAGKLYILDGAFVNPSGALDSSIGTALNPVPTLTALSPLSATVGAGGTVITITGRDFVGQPTVEWNGNALVTTAVSNTELQATVPASDLTAAGQASVTVMNPSPVGGSSNSLPFSINPPAAAGNQIAVYAVGGNDLVWNFQAQKIYVSVPAIQGDLGNTMTVVDPVAGTVSPSPFVGSEPGNLSISSDDQYLYAGMYGENSVQRFVLPGLSPDIDWHLGADPFDGAYFPLSLQVAPGSPHTTAVNLGNFIVSPSSEGGIVIYDDATPRPIIAPGWGSSVYSYASLQWGGDVTTLYAPAQEEPTDFYVLAVSPSGVTLAHDYPGAVTVTLSGFGIHYDAGTGLVYVDGGQVINPTTGATVGNYGASGIALPDSALDVVFFLGQTAAQVGTSNFTVESFDQQKFTSIASITVPNVVGTPTDLIRWGTNGLAFATRVGAPTDFYRVGPGQLYVISGDFVTAAAEASSSKRSRPAENVRRTWDSSKSSFVRPAHRSGLGLASTP